MAEYIDREEAKEWIAAWLKEDKYWHPYSKGKNIPTADVFDTLSLIPAADVQPVKHGRWDGYETCSVCGASKSYFFYCTETGDWDGDWNYCPNCGARMDGEA